ncbi:MAG: hypothetical protein AAGK79_17385 [Pseudomonadota bacterium]
MLETIALCMVLLDWEAIRMSFLPEVMEGAMIAEYGVDIGAIDLTEALGAAAEGDAGVALAAIRHAEIEMFAMTSPEAGATVAMCADKYGFLGD